MAYNHNHNHNHQPIRNSQFAGQPRAQSPELRAQRPNGSPPCPGADGPASLCALRSARTVHRVRPRGSAGDDLLQVVGVGGAHPRMGRNLKSGMAASRGCRQVQAAAAVWRLGRSIESQFGRPSWIRQCWLCSSGGPPRSAPRSF
jgi:hypothetical protein